MFEKRPLALLGVRMLFQRPPFSQEIVPSLHTMWILGTTSRGAKVRLGGSIRSLQGCLFGKLHKKVLFS